ncbi:Vesicle-associated membrane protein 727 [Rhynchospora pubera]|uniref:Vesicle-associated membrane protein 727 n=1 Tax=Rhynchospora pubera TaxID=906938 RepID=A0AAV8G9H4_9POAL|nr:Vesicle-associated membrane protein 727 [Rhynchospora pubera]
MPRTKINYWRRERGTSHRSKLNCLLGLFKVRSLSFQEIYFHRKFGRICLFIPYVLSLIYQLGELKEDKIMNKQPLIYSFVAKGTVVLAEHTSFSGNFSTVAIQCLQKLPPNSNKFTYSCDGHTFNFLVDKGFVFLVVADEGLGRSVPFVFLERVKEDFVQRYGSAIGDEEGGTHPFADDVDEDDDLFEDRFSIAYSLDREFGPRLKEHMQYCINHPEEMSKLSKLKAQITEVKGIMMDNIEKVLDRGEKIELLVDKTETLQFQADSFQRHGRQLRRKMWLQNLQFKLMVAGAIFVFILIVWLAACKGFSCSNKS